MMLKILIVDDEAPSREELRYLLSILLKTAVIYEAGSGEEALGIVQKESIAAAFIDINMPDIDGIALSKEIYSLDNDIKIVFATAYDLYAVKAFEINAVDYILKPFEEERLKLTIKKVFKDEGKKEKLNTSATKAFASSSELKVKKLSVWKGDRVLLVDIRDIVYITTDERNSIIKTTSGEFISNQSISYLEEKLRNENFFRVHRSYLINLEQVKEIQPWINNSYIVLMNGYEKDEIPVSRKQIKNLKDVFGF